MISFIRLMGRNNTGKLFLSDGHGSFGILDIIVDLSGDGAPTTSLNVHSSHDKAWDSRLSIRLEKVEWNNIKIISQAPHNEKPP